jgi:hypothetical protein
MTFPNTARGLRLAGTDFVYLTEGAYGTIFADRGQRRVRKVYRTRPEVDTSHCREVFNTEIQAYEIASKHSELSALVPAYFGPCDVPDVVDGANANVSNEFHSDLAFEAEFVECFLQPPNTEQARIDALFGRYGIHYVTDASVCLEEDAIRKMIDFATKHVGTRRPRACWPW